MVSAEAVGPVLAVRAFKCISLFYELGHELTISRPYGDPKTPLALSDAQITYIEDKYAKNIAYRYSYVSMTSQMFGKTYAGESHTTHVRSTPEESAGYGQ